METPATLLPDYLKEKKMPAMSEEMKMTFIALQQEQREMERYGRVKSHLLPKLT